MARYYTAVYSSAARLTDDPRQAVALTREAFNEARKQLQSIRSQTAIATVLIAAVLRAGLADADLTFVTPNFALAMLAPTAA